IFTAIRAAVPGLILATRLNAFDGVPFHKAANGDGAPDSRDPTPNGWGLSASDPLTPDLTEPLRWVREMRQLGVELVNVTLGTPLPRAPGPQAGVPDVQLPHGTDAGEAPPARPVPGRLPAVRQGGLRRGVEGSSRASQKEVAMRPNTLKRLLRAGKPAVGTWL